MGGAATPISKIGQAAAAATRADSHIFLAPLVSPKRATTAQPNTADNTRPSERLTRARSAWMIAIDHELGTRAKLRGHGRCLISAILLPPSSIRVGPRGTSPRQASGDMLSQLTTCCRPHVRTYHCAYCLVPLAASTRPRSQPELAEEGPTMKVTANGISMNYTFDGPASAPV